MKIMNLSWCEDFLALVATKNFSRAAYERNMTQPAFSRRVRALEEWMGVELFNRSTQPVSLTSSGEWFQGIARDMLARSARIPGEAKAFIEANAMALRIASTHALSFTFMPDWLRGLESKITIGQIQLVSDVKQRCETLLQQSHVQFLLTHAHPNVRGELDRHSYPSVVVGRDLLIPVSAPTAEKAPLHSVKNASLRNPIRFLNYSQESGIGKIASMMQENLVGELPTKNVFTAHLASVLRTMVLDGRGIAWLPETLISDDLKRGLLVVAAPDSWKIEVQIRLYRDKAIFGKAGESFWDAVCTS